MDGKTAGFGWKGGEFSEQERRDSEKSAATLNQNGRCVVLTETFNTEIMIRSFLFPRYADGRGFSLFLLAMRVVFGLLLMSHGLDKLVNFEGLAAGFPDPLGIGSSFSLMLAIFGELFCATAFLFGFLYRLAMIPMIVSMAVAFFAVHGGNLAQGELAFAYLMVFVLLYATGPGRYALDSLIGRSLAKA